MSKAVKGVCSYELWFLINIIEMDCPICNKVHLFEHRKRLTQSIVKDEVVDFEEIYFLCTLSEDDENEFFKCL